MTRDDEHDLHDDLDLGPIPAPDAEPDAGERARARSFGDLIDKVIAGRAPAAVPAEDRALLEVATVLRASVRPVELPAARAQAVVESALATAIERRGGGRLTDPRLPAVSAPGVVPIHQARWRRLAPWAIAAVTSAVAAAAVTALIVRGPARPAPVATAPALPYHQRSRPADPLIGAIDRAASGDALSRIDTIYADRLDGFRERTLDGPRRGGGKP